MRSTQQMLVDPMMNGRRKETLTGMVPTAHVRVGELVGGGQRIRTALWWSARALASLQLSGSLESIHYTVARGV